MSTAPTTAFGAGLTEDQRDAVRRSKTRLELAGHLNDGVVTRYVLRARLAELDDLDKRFLARHPIFRFMSLCWMSVATAFFFWLSNDHGTAENVFESMKVFPFAIMALSVVLLTIDYTVLGGSRRRERALIEALLYQEQILPPGP